MPKQLTQEEFLEKVKTIHGENYDLSKAVYTGAKEKVIVKCTICGTEKPILPKQLYVGTKCKTCLLIERNKKGIKTLEKFITDSKRIHGEDRYKYDRAVYIDSYTDIELYCTVCKKYFWKNPQNHLNNKQGCQTCGHQNGIDKNTNDLTHFIKRVEEIFPNQYTFEKSIYTYCLKPITVTCKKHGEFTKLASEVMRGHGCPICGKEEMTRKMSYSFQEFSEKFYAVHKDDYVLIEESYTKATDMVDFICTKHGKQTARGINLLRGSGCSICKNSKGEKAIDRYLRSHNLHYKAQKSFKDCRHEGALLFDFYVPELDLLIEYHGRQHYDFVEFFHKTPEGFEQRKVRDKIKKEYAEKNHNFLEIPYWDLNNIEELLNEAISALISK